MLLLLLLIIICIQSYCEQLMTTAVDYTRQHIDQLLMIDIFSFFKCIQAIYSKVNRGYLSFQANRRLMEKQLAGLFETREYHERRIKEHVDAIRENERIVRGYNSRIMRKFLCCSCF